MSMNLIQHSTLFAYFLAVEGNFMLYLNKIAVLMNLSSFDFSFLLQKRQNIVVYIHKHIMIIITMK